PAPVVPPPPAPEAPQPPAPQPPAPTAAAPKPPATTKAPQPKATTAKPPADPEPEPAPKETVAAAGDCEIRSNAGNCYKAGQFCRNDDLGRSTHEAGGRVIYCRMVSGKPHWQA
ncbi:hypothetical protein ACFVVX_34085, partial [Kitasatospora sp. NPDC058170]